MIGESDDDRARKLHYELRAAVSAVGAIECIKAMRIELPVPTVASTTLCVFCIIEFVNNWAASRRS